MTDADNTTKHTAFTADSSWSLKAEILMEWDELKEKVQSLKRPTPPENAPEALQQQIRSRFAELSVAGVGGSIEAVLEWLENVDASRKGTDAHRYALRTLDDIIDMGQGVFVRDSLENLIRHLREAIEKLSDDKL